MGDKGDAGWPVRIVGYGTKRASEFQANPLNWRDHPPEQREAVAASLRSLGWVDVVIENVRTGHLVDGHERVWQALQAGDLEVPYIQVDLDPDEEALALATLDPITGMARANSEKLAELLDEVQTSEQALLEVLAELAQAVPLAGETTEDEASPTGYAAELQEKWGVEAGQVWEVPSRTAPRQVHRIACGDATDPAVWEAALAGREVHGLVTDPPYGIAVKGEDWDTLEDDELLSLLYLTARNALDRLREPAALAVFFSTRTFPIALQAFGEAGARFLRALWLYKRNDRSYPWRGWLLISEIILLFQKGEGNPFTETRQGGEVQITHDTYLHERQGLELPDQPKDIHAVVKPLWVTRDLVGKVARRGRAVADPFLGTGTTAVAAEHLGRVCYGIELEPRHVAVALERLAELGLEPRCVSG